VELALLADEAGLTLIQLAIAFVLNHPAVTAPIIGPATVRDLEELVESVDISLSDDVLKEIDRIFPAPRGHFYADPFLISRGDSTYLFFEDYDYALRRAVISCASVSPAGVVGPALVVLTAAHHLSYPYLLTQGDDVFMIPEAAASGGVQLYRADPFPGSWTHVRTLYEGAYPVDTSAWYDAERWWFFTTLREPRSKAQALYLFHSQDLTGPWQLHPESPISVDVRRDRGAGAIFTDGGRLIRPSQDGSRDYGSSWSLNEIEELTTTAYRERPMATVMPDWAPGMTGTHTYSRSPGLEAVDAKVLVPARTARPGS
jgi:hypothetical protein